MPRNSRKIPAYRLHKARNLGCVTLDGRVIYLGRFDSPESRAEYDRVIREWLAAGRQAPVARPRPPALPGVCLSLNEVLVRYLAFCAEHYRRDGVVGREVENIRASLRPLRRLYGTTDAGAFGPTGLKAIRHLMIEQGLARSTINGRVGRIKKFFKWAVAEELVAPAVYQGLAAVDGLQPGRSGARETAPIQPVTEEQIAAILPHLTAPVRAMVQAQAATGMRPGELVRMKCGEIDRTGPVWLYKPCKHKNQWRGLDRVIPIGPRAQAIIGPFLKDDPAAVVFRPMDGFPPPKPARKPRAATPGRPARTKPGSGRRINERYSVLSYYASVARACDKARPHATLEKIPRKDLTPEQRAELRAWRRAHRWNPNRLRHYAATAIRARFGLEAAQVVLGHSRADTSQIYAQRDMAKAVEVARSIG